jgi:Zn-dependent protease/predicted transcriptional regulator
MGEERSWIMPGYRIGSLGGFDVYINVSWLIAIVLITFSTATGWFPRVYPGQSTITYSLLGFLSAILLFVSVLLHEFAHSLVARARGINVKYIVLFIFGGVSTFEQEAKTPGTEFLVAVVGPLTSLLIGAVAFLLLLPLRGRPSAATAILSYLAIVNILLGIFNLIPGFPLDGGRVLRGIIWRIVGNIRTATNVTTIVGQVIAYLFILAGIWLLFTNALLTGVWLGFIGWFMLNAAQSMRAQVLIDSAFHGVTVEQVMSRNVVTTPANISLQKLVDDYLLPQGLRSIPVVQGDLLVGLITLRDITQIPREQWNQTPVGVAMVPVEKLHVVSPQQHMQEVLPLMNSRDVNQLPVVQGGHLVGILNRESIVRALEIRRHLGIGRTV